MDTATQPQHSNQDRVAKLSNDSSLGADSIAHALESLQDCVVIVDYRLETIKWCSSAFAERFATAVLDFKLSKLYDNFRGLKIYLDKVTSETFGETPIFRTECLPLCYAKDSRVLNTTVVQLSDSEFVLRMVDGSDSASERQRYLEDREQLFSTSRTISVSEMATTLAHEMNQPIGTISNLLQGIRLRLQNGQDDNPGVIQALDRALEQTAFSAGIITRIRDYTHTRRPQHEPIKVKDLLTSCISLLDWEIQRDDIQLRWNCSVTEHGQTVVMGDKTMLQQVVVNLLRNSIDAMRNCDRKSRALCIGLAIYNQQIEITLADTGSGLSQTAHDNLFVPFVSSKPTGMGVGLNICRSFIEIHQGKLWLSSESGSECSESNDNKSNNNRSQAYKRGCTAHILLPVAS